MSLPLQQSQTHPPRKKSVGQTASLVNSTKHLKKNQPPQSFSNSSPKEKEHFLIHFLRTVLPCSQSQRKTSQEDHTPMTLMDIHANTLNKIRANQTSGTSRDGAPRPHGI